MLHWSRLQLHGAAALACCWATKARHGVNLLHLLLALELVCTINDDLHTPNHQSTTARLLPQNKSLLACLCGVTSKHHQSSVISHSTSPEQGSAMTQAPPPSATTSINLCYKQSQSLPPSLLPWSCCSCSCSCSCPFKTCCAGNACNIRLLITDRSTVSHQ
jgi:hypothetical protein